MTVFLAILTTILGFVGNLLQGRDFSDQATKAILREIDLYERLPSESTVRGELLGHIDQQTRSLIVGDETRRRNPTGMALSALTAGGAIGFAYLGATAGSWGWLWWPVAFVVGLFAVAGVAEAIPKVARDDAGRQLHRNSKKSAA